MTRRRALRFGLAAAAALLAVHALAWWQAERVLDRGWQAWRSRARLAGWRVEAAAPAWAGYPFAAGLDIGDISIAAAPPVAAPAWRGAFGLRIVPWRPGRITLRPRGEQYIGWNDGPALAISADRFAATMPLQGDAPRIAVLAGGLRLTLPEAWGGGTARIGDATVLARWAEPAVLSLRMEAIDLPPALPPFLRKPADALGSRLSSLSLDASLSGAEALPALLSGPLTPGRLIAWPGRLRIPELALGWGPLGLSGHGELGLDQAARPEGHAELRLLGAANTLDALSGRGVVAPGVANAAKGIVALLSRPTEGGVAELDTPAALENGTLLVSGIPLARFGPLDFGPGK